MPVGFVSELEFQGKGEKAENRRIEEYNGVSEVLFRERERERCLAITLASAIRLAA